MLSQAGKVALTRYESLRCAEEFELRWPGDDTEPVMAHLAHELRQPLSVIETCAYYLTLILPAGDLKARAQLEKMRCQVEQANRILSDRTRRPDPMRPRYPRGPAETPLEAVDVAGDSRPLTKSATASVTN